ncbi:YihY/virulence factor BrkB family protein [Ilumatobacter sp.]|uniref:YihY/virulence factor BrkB family protein n=1 Tax=Ilumatobacter sp. TaxID=1967498 RepID=UPI003B52722A
MAWTTNATVMRFRSRYRIVDLVVEMLDGWRRHQSSKDAWLLAFFTFLSIFPLLLVAVTVLGIVLRGNPDLQERIVDSAMAQIPVVGGILETPDRISGGTWALIFGLAGALWSSGRAFVGLQTALDDVWEIPLDDRANLPIQRAKAVLGVAIIGISQIGNLAIASLVSAATLPALGDVALTAATVGINICVIASMYRFLTSYSPSWDDVWLGAVIAGVVFAVLQHFGTGLVKNFGGTAPGADPDPVQIISIIIGLITWLSFVGITVMMCAELNAARERLTDRVSAERGRELSLSMRTGD